MSTTMPAFPALLLMVAAALGGGALTLRACGVLARLSVGEQFSFSFVIGIGVTGWAIFFLGLMSALSFWPLLFLMAGLSAGLCFLFTGLRGFGASARQPRPNGPGMLLIAGILTVMFFDLLEGLSPPADADSLSYHFRLPRNMLDAASLLVSYQAVEGAIPLLQQMGYTGALGLGGELTMTLWTMISGWACATLIYLMARRYLDFNSSLALTLVFLSTPAVVYGAGSGQVEVRNAAFVLSAVMFFMKAVRTEERRYLVVAGLSAGFFAASKYTGLIGVFACAAPLLFYPRRLSNLAVFVAAALAAGSQWYLWNWYHAGDPLFPMLYGLIDYPADVPWNDSVNRIFAEQINEKILPANLLWALIYPVLATLKAAPEFESLRTGLGPLALLILPISLLGIWRGRSGLSRHPLAVAAMVCLTAYLVWFLFGPSQRIRHLLPWYPLAILCLMTAAAHAVRIFPSLKNPVYALVTCTICIQVAGSGLFGHNAAVYVFGNETRDEYLARNVIGYTVLQDIRPELPQDSHLLTTARQLLYLVDTPVTSGNAFNQAVVETHARSVSPGKFLAQIDTQGITHILVPFAIQAKPVQLPLHDLLAKLVNARCMKVQREVPAKIWSSRTLPSMSVSHERYSLLVRQRHGCQVPTEKS